MTAAADLVRQNFLAARCIELEEEVQRLNERITWLTKVLAELSARRTDDPAVRLVRAIDFGLEET
jgi:hypothetical protein